MAMCPKCGEIIHGPDLHWCQGGGEAEPQIVIKFDLAKLLDKGWRVRTKKQISNLFSSAPSADRPE